MPTLQLYNKDKIDSILFYSPGDKFAKAANGYTVGGIITGGSQQIKFTLYTPKSLEKISTLNVTKLNLIIRLSQGGYIAQAWTATGYDYLNSSNTDSISIEKYNNHYIDITIQGKAAWKTNTGANITKDQVLGIDVIPSYFEIEFN